MGEKATSGGDGTSNGQPRKIGGMGAPAKGILKSSQNTDQLQQSQAADSSFLAPGDIQIPNRIISRTDVLDGNNTTSRINTLALQDKVSRRVSFAPDVTLHSFDFVPETKTSLREPRRRPNEILVTSTQNEEIAGEIEDESLSMDLTSPVTMPKQSYKPVFDQEVSMEITQLFPKHIEAQDNDKEETMEFTALQDRLNNAVPEQSTMEITEVHSYRKPEVASPPETPPSSKRRKLNEPTGSVSRSDSSEDQDMELSLMEKLSPIRLNSVEPKVTEPEPEVEQSHSLQEFIQSTGLSFFIDTDLLDKTITPVGFEKATQLQSQDLRLNKVLNVLYMDTPVLEMNAFIAKELLHRIEQSKRQFDDLDHQINSSSPPPLLLSEYFNASHDMKQSMNQQFQLVKSYSKLKAKKSWFEWRFQHLKGIKLVLEENLAVLREEISKVEFELTKAREVRSQAAGLRDAIRKEIMILKELPPEAYQEERQLSEKVKLEQLKQELALYAVDMANSQALTEMRNELKMKKDEKTAQLLALKDEISKLQSEKKLKKNEFTDYDIKRSRAKLDMLGEMSGVKFIRFKNSELTLKFTWLEALQSLTINLSSLNNGEPRPYKITGAADMTLIFDHCYNSTINNRSLEASTACLSHLLTSAEQSQALMKAYSLLQLLFPVDIRLKNDMKVIEIKDIDLRANSKVIYEMSLDEFLAAALETKEHIRVKATILRQGQSSSTSNPSAFVKKMVKILPWFEESRVVFLQGTLG